VLTARQNDLICSPELIITEDSPAAPNGGLRALIGEVFAVSHRHAALTAQQSGLWPNGR
jgi:hypothetical protein